MQRRSLLSTAAILAALSAGLLISSQRAQAQAEAVLYNFCPVSGCLDGAAPDGNLAPDGYGGFYGTTYFGGTSAEGGGTVFQLVPEPAGGCPRPSTPGNGWCEYVLYNFCQISTSSSNCADGSNPSSLILARTGTFENPILTLYGTTFFGGAGCAGNGSSGCGTVFQLSPETPPQGCPSGTISGNNGWCEKVIYNFCQSNPCNDGVSPAAGVVRDSAGNLYGPAYGGVFELTPNGSGGWTESLIYSDSNSVVGGLAVDSGGHVYGVDRNPNTAGWGNVFKLTDSSGSWVASTIHAFDGSLVGTTPDGLFPNGQPVVDSAGNLYGTTAQGGSKDLGTVWKLVPVTTGPLAGTYKEKVLHSFYSETTGYNPASGVTLDSSGNIYGTTAYGGKYFAQCKNGIGTAVGCGIEFKLALSGETYTYKLLWNFDNTDGFYPGSLTLGSSGDLYGTAEGGADGQGAVFELNPSGAVTTTTLTASPNPSTLGETVTFTATVNSGAGAPPDGETVSFMKGSTSMGTGTLSGGVATLMTSSLAVGSFTIDAVYGGDLNFAPSTSKAVNQVVKR